MPKINQYHKNIIILFLVLIFSVVTMLTIPGPHTSDHNGHSLYTSSVDNHSIMGLIPHGKVKINKTFISEIVELFKSNSINYFKVPIIFISVWFSLILLLKILFLRPFKFTTNFIN